MPTLTTTFNSIIFFPIPHLIIEYLYQPLCICHFNHNCYSYDNLIYHEILCFLLLNKTTVKYMKQFELLKKPPSFYKIPNNYISFFDISYICSIHDLTFTHYTRLISSIDVLLHSKYNMLPVNVDDIPDDINNIINNLIGNSNKEFIHTDDYIVSASFKNFIRKHCKFIKITQESCCSGLGFAISFFGKTT